MAHDGAFWRARFSKRRVIFIVWRAGAHGALGARFSKLAAVAQQNKTLDRGEITVFIFLIVILTVQGIRFKAFA